MKNVLFALALLSMGCESVADPASCEDPTKTTETRCEQLKIDQEELALELSKEAPQLTYKIIPADASTEGLEWTSSDETVVKVDKEGRLILVGPGTAIVTVHIGDKVSDNASKITVTDAQVTPAPPVVLTPSFEVIHETLLIHNPGVLTGAMLKEHMVPEKTIHIIVDGTCTEIADHAFEEVEIDDVEIKSPDLTRIGHFAFKECTAYTVILPATVTTIGDESFSGAYIEKIDLPALTHMGREAFYEAGYLDHVNLGGGIAAIPDNAFMDCFSLRGITLPEGVKSIGDSAFYRAGLTWVELPASLERIEEFAFAGSTTLRSVQMLSPVPPSVADGNFGHGHWECTLYVPKRLLKVYQNAEELLPWFNNRLESIE